MKKGIHSSIHWVCLAGAVGFLCGCRTPQPATQDSTRDLPPKTRVKLAALAELNVPGKPADGNVGACFILVDEDELSFFENYFKDNVPRIAVSAGKDNSFKDLTRDAQGGVVDKLTSKPGKLLGFQKIEIKGDQAHVELVESESLSAITIHVFEMSLQKGKWTVLVHTRKAIS